MTQSTNADSQDTIPSSSPTFLYKSNAWRISAKGSSTFSNEAPLENTFKAASTMLFWYQFEGHGRFNVFVPCVPINGQSTFFNAVPRHVRRRGYDTSSSEVKARAIFVTSTDSGPSCRFCNVSPKAVRYPASFL